MARKTDGEKIDELEKPAATLVERVDGARNELKTLHGGVADWTRNTTEIKTGMAILQRDMEELRRENASMRKDQEEVSKKRWSLLPPAVGAVVSGIISFIVAYFVAKK